MNCIETLARVDVLCVDKTGTITEARMEAGEPLLLAPDAWPQDRVYTVLHSIYAGTEPDNDTARAMVQRFGKQNGMPWPRQSVVPFNSAYKWSAATFAEGSFVVGAPELVAGARYAELAAQVEPLLEKGSRVLLLARCDAEPDPKVGLDADKLEFVALLPVANRIRPEAPETFRYFAEQGVAVKVISGDNPVAVSEVARQAGIEGAERYVDAATLDTDEKVAEAVRTCTVFGRVTPAQKRKFVKALQADGHTVAMTGDGVNDVLALKESDCSIAMQSGSDAARNVSNIVLLDSNFASMPKIVGEGRRSINNIERSSVLFLYKTVYSFLAALMFCFVPMGYPLQAIQLTQINMFTNGIPSFLLAMEPNFKRVKGEFIENVLPRSIMHGLLITFNFVGIVLMRYISSWMDIIPRETFDYSIETMSTICIGFAAFVILFKVCMPFKPWKIGLFVFLIGGFTADIFILRDFLLDLKPMCFEMIVMTGILMGATVLIEALSSFFERHITDNLLAFQRYWKDVFIRMSAKRKAGKENKNA